MTAPLKTRFTELSASITVLAEQADTTTDLQSLLTIRREAEQRRSECDQIILALSASGEIDATRACLRTVRLNGLAIAQIRARGRVARIFLTSNKTTVTS